VKPGGRILMKLNDHYPDEDLRECDAFNEITPGFYHETSGLFLWNLSEADIENLVKPWFELEHSGRVELKKDEFYNRLYYLRKRP